MPKSTKAKKACFYCGKEYVDTNYYNSQSKFFDNTNKIPYCKQCMGKLYEYFLEKYKNEGCISPEKKSVKRLCMAFDINFDDKAYENAINSAKRREMNITPLSAYMKMAQLLPLRNRTYDDTIFEEEHKNLGDDLYSDFYEDEAIDEKTIKFFGEGFSNEDYRYLKEQYEDWVTRHECNTKAQEELFKRICFKQLEILKATRRGEDTKNLDATFQNLLDTAKLQPKQNSGDTVSETQTFGTLIDKWETTRPIPEVDDELKDVDKIGLYLEVFFKGHLAKMMGLKNGLSNLYTKFMKKYTVERPEYNDDEDGEALFDAIFGNANIDDN